MFPKLVLASRNLKKSSEIRALLGPHDVKVVSVADFPEMPEVEEDGETFAANAARKASQTAQRLGLWALGEDSGLRVQALGGAPGVYSARYSGPAATDASNNARLVQELLKVPEHQRSAEYVCHVAVSDPLGNIRLSVEATCRGRIVLEARGQSGFGYDPHFLIPEYHRTFAELGPLVKRVLSHRARAFERLLPALLPLLRSLASKESASQRAESGLLGE